MKEQEIRGHTYTLLRARLILMVLVAAILCAVPFHGVMAQAPDLGTASSFSILFGAAGSLTCTATTISDGDVGSPPGGTWAGGCTIIPPAVEHHGDALAISANADLITAYAAVLGLPCTTVNGTLAGLTLTPGVYCLDASAKTGLLTLDGPTNGVWIFKTPSSAFTATNFQVVFKDGSAPCANGGRVFWWSSTDATVTNTAENFMGTILADSVTLTGGNFFGQVLAKTSVTLTTVASFTFCAPAAPIPCPTITVTPPILPSGSIGVFYSEPLFASGGTNPYTFAVTSGSLPAGLNLSSAGILSGTPTTAGSYSFTVTATDFVGCLGTRAYTLSPACPGLALLPTSLPPCVLGVAYSETLSATGGTMPYTFAVTGGSLPPGLTLSSAGHLSGIPTVAGSYSFTVTVTDATACTQSRTYTVVISACPTITLSPASLPSINLGVMYNQAIVASGGLAPYTYAVTSGTLPPGLSFSSAGILSGTPTTMGSYTFTVTATDANACLGSRTYTLAIVCPVITLSPTGLPVGTYGLSYAVTITATGGTGPYSFAVTAGSLPAGLTLSSGGLLSGAPAATGTFIFTVTATDANGCTGSQVYTLTVVFGPVVIHMFISPPCTPFRIFVKGSNFQPGMRVYIDGVEWYTVAWKNPGKIVLKGPIQHAVPPNTFRTFTFVNPDGGVASKTWKYVLPSKSCGG